MRVICIFKDNQDYTRSVTDWLEDFRRQTGREIETMDPDKDSAFCQTYDITAYPTVLAIDAQGSIRAIWRGKPLPLINEVLYYMI
ncbi:hypothetical protein IJG04_02505 [Candidatus Saccharibacteria bacterium]|nr:hypothetical protein [Candidatus Saccharibacteria bacterium]